MATSDIDPDATLDATLDASEGATRPTRRAGAVAHGPGATLGRYILLERVGSGGMGVVYAAYDPELDRKLAIKLLRSQTGDAGLRMMREAQAMAKVDHRNVVVVHDVGRVGEQVFVAMEFVDGQTLREWLAERPRERDEIMVVLLAAGEGLLAAHHAGLVHRDFKPDNVLLARDGEGFRVRVTDFGLARASDQSDAPPEPATIPEDLRHDAFATPLTRAGSVLGTPRYMAPEQHLGRTTDERSDQFAFCVTAWEALAGQHPYPADNLAQLIVAVTEDRPRGGESLPPWIRAVLLRGLAIDPDQRYPSMDALLVALARDPRRARRRALALVGVVALGAGALLGLRLDERRREQACARSAATIHESWSSQQAAELTERFASVGSDYQDEAARRTVAAFDQFAQRWQSARAASCRATTIERSRSAAEAARADECLEDARVRLAAHVEAFASIDHPLRLHQAVRASALLPDPRLCNDAGHLASIPDAPTTGESERAELRRLFARVEALGIIGRNAEAEAIASEALSKAEALGEPRWIARALHVQGESAVAAERWDQAERLLTDAFHRALVSRDDLSAAAIVLDLSYTLRSAARTGEALSWVRLGRTLIDRAGASESLQAALLELELGNVLIDRGELDQAETALRKADRLFASTLGTNDLHYSVVSHGFASLAVERGDWDQAERRFAETLELRERTLGLDHVWVADTLLSIGAMVEVRGLLDRAEQLYLRALPIYESSDGPEAWAVAAIHNNLGVVLKADGQLDQAEQHYLRAVDIWERTLGPEAAVLAHPAWGLSGIAYERGDAAAAIEQGQRCVSLRRASKASPGEIAEAELALARGLWLQGERREQALELAHAARAVYVSEGERRRKDLERLDAWLAEVAAPTE